MVRRVSVITTTVLTCFKKDTRASTPSATVFRRNRIRRVQSRRYCCIRCRVRSVRFSPTRWAVVRLLCTPRLPDYDVYYTRTRRPAICLMTVSEQTHVRTLLLRFAVVHTRARRVSRRSRRRRRLSSTGVSARLLPGQKPIYRRERKRKLLRFRIITAIHPIRSRSGSIVTYENRDTAKLPTSRRTLLVACP